MLLSQESSPQIVLAVRYSPYNNNYTLAHTSLIMENLEELTERVGVLADHIISDLHLEEIASFLLVDWRSLPPHLSLEEIIVRDIERRYPDERGRRRELLQLWRQRYGSAATYRRLIQALLEIQCRQDAEAVCRLLLRSFLPALPTGHEGSFHSVELSPATGKFFLLLFGLDRTCLLCFVYLY